MKLLAIPILLLALPASAAQVCINIPAGAPLQRLSATCDMLKGDFPGYVDEDCAFYFTVLGAGRYDAYKQRQLADAVRAASITSAAEAFKADLPLPTPVPTPTPTATSTATPTATPSATP